MVRRVPVSDGEYYTKFLLKLTCKGLQKCGIEFGKMLEKCTRTQ